MHIEAGNKKAFPEKTAGKCKKNRKNAAFLKF